MNAGAMTQRIQLKIKKEKGISGLDPDGFRGRLVSPDRSEDPPSLRFGAASEEEAETGRMPVSLLLTTFAEVSERR